MFDAYILICQIFACFFEIISYFLQTHSAYQQPRKFIILRKQWIIGTICYLIGMFLDTRTLQKNSLMKFIPQKAFVTGLQINLIKIKEKPVETFSKIYFVLSIISIATAYYCSPERNIDLVDGWLFFFTDLVIIGITYFRVVYNDKYLLICSYFLSYVILLFALREISEYIDYIPFYIYPTRSVLSYSIPFGVLMASRVSFAQLSEDKSEYILFYRIFLIVAIVIACLGLNEFKEYITVKFFLYVIGCVSYTFFMNRIITSASGIRAEINADDSTEKLIAKH